MADRVVSIRLQADASGLVQGFNRASDATNDLRNKTTSASQKIVESARNQREAWTTVGTGLTAVGVAVTGIGVAALRTGIQYNTLQQQSRAALTSLLGSAEAANAQMDKLDEWARNSPFAKQVFIEAQQQMIAFGISAENVIPYLDAIQNAVAAAGGSNQDILELSEIFGKISASSKITAIDLQQFGRRGINAAELIGQSMGKTGAEIREEITAGTIDADAAIEALAEGMATRFAGASDAVKETFAGAMDRVKAAWRDFSSELAKPLVDPDGGGALVDLLNWAADAMRSFEDLSPPVKDAIRNLVGFVGVGTLVLGSAMLVIPKLIEFGDALKTLGVNAGSASRALAGVAPAAIALMSVRLAATATEWMEGLYNASVSAEELELELRKAAGGAEAMNKAIAGHGDLPVLADDALLATDNLRSMNTTLGDMKATFESHWVGKGMSAVFLGLGRDLGRAKENIEELDQAMANMATGGHASKAAEAYEQFAEMAREAGWSQEDINEALPRYTSVQSDAKAATEDSKNQLEELAGIADTTSDAVNRLADEIAGFGESQISADRAAIKLQDEFRNLNKLVSDGSAELGILTENGSRTESALLNIADAARDSAAATLEAGGSQADANAILEDARQKLIDQRIALGENASDAEAWASRRVPTANDVARSLDGVSDSANNIPNSTRADVRTNAPSARQQLNQVESAADSIPENTPARVNAFTTVAFGALTAVVGLLNNIRGGATAEVQVRRPGGNNRAYGGTVGYANGGTINAANGVTVAGIGGGVYRGTVFGAGTAKSDSINVNLSRGEEVIQEPYASMNRQLLKSINRGQFHQGMSMGQQTVIVREVGDVYVQNPITGQYLLSKMDDRANRAVDQFVEQSAAAVRRAGY